MSLRYPPPVSAHTGSSHCRASRGLIRLTQLTTPVWQAPTACVFDSTTGRLNDPASSIQVVPVISPLPLSEYQPAAHGCPTPSRPRGRIAVTPVRTGPAPTTSGPSPPINVVTPTSTPPTSVIAFSGHRPSGAGDLSVETHGIAPIAEDQRYGTPRRLFTVWFAPQVNMTGVFTGALAIVLGLGFWLGLLAMVIGTVLGSLVVGYLSAWGPRTGAGQLPNARMAFGGAVVLPGALQWLSSIAWDA